MIIIHKKPLMRRKMHKTRQDKKMLSDEIIWPNWCQMVRGRLGMAMTKTR